MGLGHGGRVVSSSGMMDIYREFSLNVAIIPFSQVVWLA